MDYDLNEEQNIMLSNGISPRVLFGQQWMVHATGMGTMNGPQKLDQWMLIPVKPEGGRFRLSDGTGGTFGYECDVTEGPFTDNFALVAAMRRRGIRNVGDHSVQNVLDPPKDFGTPLCR